MPPIIVDAASLFDYRLWEGKEGTVEKWKRLECSQKNRGRRMRHISDAMLTSSEHPMACPQRPSKYPNCRSQSETVKFLVQRQRGVLTHALPRADNFESW